MSFIGIIIFGLVLLLITLYIIVYVIYPGSGNKDLVPNDRPIDTNDDWARKLNINFALLDNMKVSKKSIESGFKTIDNN